MELLEAGRKLCSASPLMGLDEQIMGAVVVLQELTAKRKIEEDLEQQITKFITLGVGLEQISVN